MVKSASDLLTLVSKAEGTTANLTYILLTMHRLMMTSDDVVQAKQLAQS